MKKILSICVMLFAILTVFSQSNSINYKAQINDDTGNLLHSQDVTIRVTVIEDVSAVYAENHNATKDLNGLVVLVPEEGNVELGDYNTIDWGADDHLPNVEVDSGTDFIDLGDSVLANNSSGTDNTVMDSGALSNNLVGNSNVAVKR